MGKPTARLPLTRGQGRQVRVLPADAQVLNEGLGVGKPRGSVSSMIPLLHTKNNKVTEPGHLQQDV